MSDDKKNTLTTHSTKPLTPQLPPRPQMPQFNKPSFNKNIPKFSQAFRTQSRGSGGK